MTTNREARRAIEAILMVADQPIEPNLLAQVCEVPVATVEEICAELAASYEAEERGFVLARVAGGYRYQSHPDLAPYIERFVLDGQSARLSAAALETLAIVAYKQPISRAQVASIRGVSVDGVMKTLQARGYITEVGRDPGPGNAVLFGTTPVFLERLGLDSVDQLPALGAFVPGADVVEQLERTLRVSDDPDASPPLPPSPTTEGPVVDAPAVLDDAAAVLDDAAVEPVEPAEVFEAVEPAEVLDVEAHEVVEPAPAGAAERSEDQAPGFPGGEAVGSAGGGTGGFAGDEPSPILASSPLAPRHLSEQHEPSMPSNVAHPPAGSDLASRALDAPAPSSAPHLATDPHDPHLPGAPAPHPDTRPPSRFAPSGPSATNPSATAAPSDGPPGGGSPGAPSAVSGAEPGPPEHGASGHDTGAR